MSDGTANGAHERTGLLSYTEDDSSRKVMVLACSRAWQRLILVQIIDFTDWDDEDPRNWPRSRKFVNVGIIALMAGMQLTPLVDKISNSLTVFSVKPLGKLHVYAWNCSNCRGSQYFR